MKNALSKALALILCLSICLTLFPAAFAWEGESWEDDPGDMGEDSAYANVEVLDAETLVPVVFPFDGDCVVTVYELDGDGYLQTVWPDEDGIYYLLSGVEYFYDAEADGCEPLFEEPLEVYALDDPWGFLEIPVDLIPAAGEFNEETTNYADEETDDYTVESAGDDTVETAGDDTVETAGDDTVETAGDDTVESAGDDTDRAADSDDDETADREAEVIVSVSGEETDVLKSGENKPTEESVGKDVIVGFESLEGMETIETEYKLVMDELRELFPSELIVHTGGTVFYEKDSDGRRTIVEVKDYNEQPLMVVWKCVEGYDADCNTFHFRPELEEDYKLAEGVELPEITVNIERTPEIRDLVLLPEMPGMDVPVLGILTMEGVPRLRGMPSTYRTPMEYLPDVRDQGTLEACWAHAAIGCMETDLIHDEGLSMDLSELHLSYFTYHPYFDEKGCSTGDTTNASGTTHLTQGGNATIAYRTLANMVGPAKESSVPYSDWSNYYPGAEFGRYDNCSVQLSGAYNINIADRDAIKANIMAHGGVAASMYVEVIAPAIKYPQFNLYAFIAG